MKGRHRIRVSNRTVSYDFTICRNITILQGDSATGKTTLVEMIAEYESLGPDSAVHLQADCPCVVLQGSRWEKQLEGVENSVVFIDEGNRFTASEEFAHAVRESTNYYVIVTREALYNLPYSVQEIYGIRSSGKYNSLQPVYHEMYRIYSEIPSGTETVDTVITEDSNAGFEFFNQTKKQGITCRSAGGNSGIFQLLEAQKLYDHVLIIADGAAFGPYMELLSPLVRKHPGIILYLPESFEWLILRSGLVDGNRVREILGNPATYIDSREYFSWERFFTALLVRETEKTFLSYNKIHLNRNYLQDREKEAVLQTLPPEIRALF